MINIPFIIDSGNGPIVRRNRSIRHVSFTRDSMELRIATYNIHKGASIDHRPIIQELKRSIRSLSADVVFLQEVQGRHDSAINRQALLWQEQGQHAYLAGDSLYCAYGKNAVYNHGHHGNALLSAYPIVSQFNRDVSDHAMESRGILHCVIQTPETKVYCYVIHLGLFNGSRIRQTRALIRTVQASAPKDAPVIIAGDFNDWNNKLSGFLMRTLQVKEVFDELDMKQNGKRNYFPRLTGMIPKPMPARTFPALFPFFRLDRIYVRGFEVDSASVMQGSPWTSLSDHAPLVASLRIK